MADYSKIDTYLERNLDRSIDELKRLVAQPSVGAQNLGLKECAQLVAGMLKQRGFQVQIMDTPGAPVVFGERKGKSDRTLLFYNHYDVQPPEPLELWHSAPFDPVIRDGALFARGAKDDKGEFVARLAALDALEAVHGSYPCRITFLVEGEEEIGSPHLPPWVERHAERLRAD